MTFKIIDQTAGIFLHGGFQLFVEYLNDVFHRKLFENRSNKKINQHIVFVFRKLFYFVIDINELHSINELLKSQKC